MLKKDHVSVSTLDMPERVAPPAATPLDATAPGAPRLFCSYARYWTATYVYARASGLPAHTAEDIVKALARRLEDASDSALADNQGLPDRRVLLRESSDLVASYTIPLHRNAEAEAMALPHFDASEGERSWSACVDGQRPGDAFDSTWMAAARDRAVLRIDAVCRASGEKLRKWAQLRGFMFVEPPAVMYASVAERLGCSMGAARVAVYRLRRSLRGYLEQELRSTVDDDRQLQVEMVMATRDWPRID